MIGSLGVSEWSKVLAGACMKNEIVLCCVFFKALCCVDEKLKAC